MLAEKCWETEENDELQSVYFTVMYILLFKCERVLSWANSGADGYLCSFWSRNLPLDVGL